jgi:serine/threonine protein kinase
MLVDDLSLVEPLGKGSFSEVFLALKQGTNEKFALKILDKECDTNPIAKKYLNSEIAIHKDIKHENIVKLYDVKKTSQNFCLVTEYCNGGSLYDRFKKISKYS